MLVDVTASASAPRERGARLRRPSRRATRTAGTLALLAVAVACALLVWPGFLRGGTAYVIVSGQSMEPALHAGDLVLTVRQRTYDVGDVVAYRIPPGQPGAGVLVIHRIVGGSASSGYITQGDNRDGRDPWRPRPRDVVGAEGVSVPRLGLALVYLRTPLGLAALAGIVTALLILGGPTNGAPEGAGAKPSLGVRLRRGIRDETVDPLDGGPLPGGMPIAPGRAVSACTTTLAARCELARPALGAVLLTVLVVAMHLAEHRL
jgi:signal peptidase